MHFTLRVASARAQMPPAKRDEKFCEPAGPTGGRSGGGSMARQRLSFLQIWNMCFGFFGIQ
ncbi:MAG: MFS transporter, partial [Caulobacter sp.]